MILPRTTPRLLLRNWRTTDIELFHRIFSDEQVMRFFPVRLSRDEAAARLESLTHEIEMRGFGFSAVERLEDGACIGFVGLNPVHGIPTLDDGAVEIGWRLAPEFWGHGYASEAAVDLIDAGFRDLGLAEIVAFAIGENHASVSVMRRIGMQADPARDFNHPRVPSTRPDLIPHVMYRITRGEWEKRSTSIPSAG